MVSELPQYQPEQLEQSPLALVVSQVRFPPILSIPTDDNLLAQFQDRIRDRYPVLFIGHQMGFSLGLEEIQQQQGPTRSFQFADPERQWIAALSINAVSLESRRYTNIDEFTDRLLKVLAAAKDIYRIDVRQRLGLRYVNEIRYPGAVTASDWRSLIRTELLGPLSDESIANNSVSVVQELSLKIPDGSLTLRHGFLPQGTTVAPALGTSPSEGGPFYLLDLDAFDDQGGEIDDKVLATLLERYNKTVYSLFRWGLSEKLFGYLKGST